MTLFAQRQYSLHSIDMGCADSIFYKPRLRNIRYSFALDIALQHLFYQFVQ